MMEYKHMETAKYAAKTLVETLTVAKRVSVIPLSTGARLLQVGEGGRGGLVRATIQNKGILLQAIDGLDANGAANFHSTFSMTFEALEQTVQ